MAKLKDRTKILSRDDSFSARLAVPAPKKTPKPTDAPRAPSIDTRKGPANGNAVNVGQSNHPEQEKKPALPPGARSEPKPSDRVGKAELTDQNTVTLRVSFRCPADLSERVDALAEVARCRSHVVLLKAMDDLRPQLVHDLQAGLKYTDVPTERMENTKQSVKTILSITQDAHERLVKEIDPLAMTGIEAPIARWVRVRFIPHLNNWLEAKGF